MMLKSSSGPSGTAKGASLAGASHALEILPAGAPEIVGDTATVDQLGKPPFIGFDQGAILVRQEQNLGVAIVEHLLERIGRSHGRERHHAGAGAQATHEGLDIFDRVGGEDGDLVALAYAHARKRARDPVDATIELRPRPRRALADHGALVGEGGGMTGDADGDRQEFREVVLRRLRDQHRIGAHGSPTSSARPSRPDRPTSSRR